MSDDSTRELLPAGLAETIIDSQVPQLIADRDACVVLASAGATHLLKCRREDIVGRPMSGLVALSDSGIPCRQIAYCESGEPFTLEFLTPDRSVVPVEVYCSRVMVSEDESFCHMILIDLRAQELRAGRRLARMAKLSLLNQVSDALYGAQLTLEQILEAVLICMTAGQGLRFNRAFLLLIDEPQQTLRGEIAIGPGDHAEANRIWHDLAGRPADLYEMMTTYDRSLRETDVVVNEIVKRMIVPLDAADQFLIRAMNGRQPLLVTDDYLAKGVETMRVWLGYETFAVAPLTTRRGPLGVIVADNAITRNEISDMDLEILQLFANQSANAIEHSRLYHELERRLMDLRKAHQRQKEDQETLLRMERLSVMGETSAIVAHELRNPLVSIGGFARSLERSLEEGDPNRQFATIITEEVARLERIINDLLDFIRPQKRLRRNVVADELVRRTIERMEQQLREQDLQLELDLQTDAVELSCHPGEFQQVVQNLVMNAMQAVKGGGKITVRTRQLAGGVEVAVIDDGPGFAPDLAEKMFAPFFSSKASGSGLGLTICAQIVRSHGGVLNAENRAEGGALFSFILPLPRTQVDPAAGVDGIDP